MKITAPLKKFLRFHSPLIFKIGRATKHFPARAARFLTPPSLKKYGEPFHGDKKWQALVEVFKNLPLTSCVETGTFLGDTTLYLSKIFPALSIYTIELSREYYRESARRFLSSKNIVLLKDSSPKALHKLIQTSCLGNFPLVFLDAHWYDYWPILDELNELQSLPRAVIMIDDFEVPGKPWFEYDIYYEGKKILKNDLSFIEPTLNDNYHILFPAYPPSAAGSTSPLLRGYIVLAKNLSEKDWGKLVNLCNPLGYQEFDLKTHQYSLPSITPLNLKTF
ncbi:MAG: hypothetical protein HY093_04190 [Candidatus Liptonbacteria bacterium]|nr:hypothetical protein [Candidatus Liptonbacteria bacterium]